MWGSHVRPYYPRVDDVCWGLGGANGVQMPLTERALQEAYGSFSFVTRLGLYQGRAYNKKRFIRQFATKLLFLDRPKPCKPTNEKRP